MEQPHKVAIVVDPIFGEKPRDLSSRLHVWACAAVANLEIIKEIQSKIGNQDSLESGVTAFKFKEGDSPEDIFLGIVDAVDLHHGEFSHNPHWMVLEVYGVKPTFAIKSKLTALGEGSLDEMENGFIFSRKRLA